MAIPEACGLWIEQRVQEEIDNKKDTGASLREIGRVVAAEVEKYFETKVNPRTVEKRAERMTATNVAPEENIIKSTVKGGDSGDKLTPTKIAKEVSKELPKAGSERKAAKVVAAKTGRPVETVRKAYRREAEKKEHIPGSGDEATEALQFSCIAISQLKRIRSDDPKRGEALDEVALWIGNNK